MRNQVVLRKQGPAYWWSVLIMVSMVLMPTLARSAMLNFLHPNLLTCDNVTDGGTISGDEVGCADPLFDPGLIVNVILPSGGSGDLEYVWMYTTVDPNLPITAWLPVPNSNSPSLDPEPISETTWYRRCSRRSGCTDYVGETGYVTKEVKCCENVTDPGSIGFDQSYCGSSFDPSPLVNVASPSGGSGNLVYSWYSSQSGPPFDPNTWTLIPGANDNEYNPGPVSGTTWFIRLVRRSDCQEELASNPVQISIFSGIDLTGVIKAVTCFGQANGGIDLMVSGGQVPYTFLWSHGPTTQNVSGLTAGTYSVLVSDANGCDGERTFQIQQPPALSMTLQVVEPACHGDETGSISIDVSGGTSPYTFLWSNGATTQTIQDLPAGSYAVTVSDQNGCSLVQDVNLLQPDALALDAVGSSVTCANAADGAIDLSVTGGTSPYSYLWSHGPTTQDVQDLAGDVYRVTVSDANGCTGIVEEEILEPAPLALTISGSDPTCLGGTDGTAVVAVSGGTAPYTYLWNDPAGSTTANISGLAAGLYQVTVTDGQACTAISQVSLADGTDDCQINIGDFVWLDSDRDGIQDANEYGENGILVKLVQPGPDGMYGNADDLVIDSTWTSGFGFNTGYYLFEDVQPGTYSICFMIDTSAFQFTQQDAGGNDTLDSDPDPNSGCVAPFTILPDDDDDLTFDAGIHARCVNVIDGGMIGYDEVLCGPGNDPEEIINLIYPAGGIGTLEYLWLSSYSDPNYFPGNPNWIPIPNSNAENYDPSPIDQTTYYIRCARREGCLDYPGESNIVTKLVVESVAEIYGPSGPLCVDEDYFFMATSNGPGATYHWEFGPDAEPQTVDGLVANNISWHTAGIQTITLTVTLEGCVAETSIQVDVEDCGGKPVFASFLAGVNDDLDVVLSWNTFDIDFDHVFLVERSDNDQDFDYVATLPGTMGAQAAYNYIDQAPRWGEQFYRIRMIGMNGGQVISPSERVVVKRKDMYNVSIIPNPVSTQLTIQLLEPNQEDATISFYDLLGREIHQEIIPAGSKLAAVDCSAWQDGPITAWIIQDGKRPYSILLQKMK
ncbi:MAG: hypothetical protein H6568_01850 [Lewinellaceae bacterium]|nr:hypothetical protein [Saprospiraceae bacterium]MCB9311484.1 hypothetical protein [Lewinellaceae bacterium]